MKVPASVVAPRLVKASAIDYFMKQVDSMEPACFLSGLYENLIQHNDLCVYGIARIGFTDSG